MKPKTILNIIVVKETEKAYTLYNTGQLYEQLGCYLERFFFKKDITLDKLEQAIGSVLQEQPELYSKVSLYIYGPIKEFDRPSDFIVKKILDLAREKLGLKQNTLDDRMGILSDVQEEINSFSSSELDSVFSKLDLDSIVENKNVDSDIKQKIKDLKQLKGIVTKLDKINQLQGDEKIREKKSIVDNLKKAGKIALASAILFGFGMSSINSAFAKSNTSSDSTSKSSYTREETSDDSNDNNSSDSDSSDSGFSSSFDDSDSDDSSSFDDSDSDDSSSSVTKSKPTPSRSRETLRDKEIKLSNDDVYIREGSQRQSFDTPSLSKLIVGIKTQETKKWDDDYVHYTQTTVYNYGKDFSTFSVDGDFEINNSWSESVTINGRDFREFDEDVFVQLSNGKVYKLESVFGPRENINYTDVEGTTTNKQVDSISVVDKYTGTTINVNDVKGVSILSTYNTEKPNVNIKSTIDPYLNLVQKYQIREHHKIITSTGVTNNDGAKTVRLNLNDDFVKFNINGQSSEFLNYNTTILVSTNSGNYNLEIYNGQNTVHKRLETVNIKETISENKYTITTGDIQDAIYNSTNGGVLTITETKDNTQIGGVTKSVQLNINEETNVLQVNGTKLKEGESVILKMKDGQVIQVTAVHKITEATKQMIYSIILGILSAIGLGALIYFVGPIVLSVLGDTKVKLSEKMMLIARRIKQTREQAGKVSEMSTADKQTVEEITKQVLQETSKTK